mmetsp:Transcript_37439/g.91749  ORF Transcript_37439/g.91749 Transcript_37439/m.91749 type:complete len:125 (+) Transcript_37439:635-1009(+)
MAKTVQSEDEMLEAEKRLLQHHQHNHHLAIVAAVAAVLGLCVGATILYSCYMIMWKYPQRSRFFREVNKRFEFDVTAPNALAGDTYDDDSSSSSRSGGGGGSSARGDAGSTTELTALLVAAQKK